MIKAVLTDIDNTLFDFDEYVRDAMRNGFEKYGLTPYKDHMFDIFTRVNTEMWKGIEKGKLTFDDLMQSRWNRIFSEIGIVFDGVAFEKYFRAHLFNSAIPVEGAEELLNHLHGKYILCIASNGPYEQQVNRLKTGGFLPYFKHIFISEKIGASKPSSDFFSYCMRELNACTQDIILPSEVIMIGDSPASDMVGAANFGIKTCYFNKENKNTEFMSADYTVTRLRDIKKIL